MLQRFQNGQQQQLWPEPELFFVVAGSRECQPPGRLFGAAFRIPNAPTTTFYVQPQHYEQPYEYIFGSVNLSSWTFCPATTTIPRAAIWCPTFGETSATPTRFFDAPSPSPGATAPSTTTIWIIHGPARGSEGLTAANASQSRCDNRAAAVPARFVKSIERRKISGYAEVVRRRKSISCQLRKPQDYGSLGKLFQVWVKLNQLMIPRSPLLFVVCLWYSVV